MESNFDKSVPPEEYFFIRLDGCSFSQFLKGVVKPFDSRITDAMVKTTGDLVLKFNAVTGYTSSDEISLVFLPAQTESTVEQPHKKRPKLEAPKTHIYNGRIQKLASVVSGYAR